jgi:GT2 family glycosyltransferase
MHTLVVIVNYRTTDLTIECLRSLQGEIAATEEEGRGQVRVVVTDNASGDGSPDRIAAAIRDNGWEAWASLMPLPKNGGFAYGNNCAIRGGLETDAPPGFIWLLNPDTVVRSGALASLQRFLEAHPRVGIVGSRLEDPDGTPQASAFRFPSLASEIDGSLRLGVVTRLLSRHRIAPPPPEGASRTGWVAGASMLIRREVFEAIGLMDEAYFMYYEEVDFCRRAADAGWECWYEPRSRVIHLVGQASGVTDRLQANKRRPAYWFESRRRYFLSHLGRGRTLLADTLFMGGFGLWRVRRRVQGKPDPDPTRFLSDFFSHSVWRRGFRA